MAWKPEWLVIGAHHALIESFVCRKPDENFEGVYRFLLKRNRRLYGVAYTLDNLGDIYLIGKVPFASVTPEEVDRVLGDAAAALAERDRRISELEEGAAARSAAADHQAPPSAGMSEGQATLASE